MFQWVWSKPGVTALAFLGGLAVPYHVSLLGRTRDFQFRATAQGKLFNSSTLRNNSSTSVTEATGSILCAAVITCINQSNCVNVRAPGCSFLPTCIRLS